MHTRRAALVLVVLIAGLCAFPFDSPRGIALAQGEKDPAAWLSRLRSDLEAARVKNRNATVRARPGYLAGGSM